MVRVSPLLLALAMGAASAGGRRTSQLREADDGEGCCPTPDLIVCERPESPVFSSNTLVDAGSADESAGRERPRAHVRAHWRQSTDQIGTTNLRSRKLARATGKRPTRPTTPNCGVVGKEPSEAGIAKRPLRRPGRGPEVRRPQPVCRAGGAKRRGRPFQPRPPRKIRRSTSGACLRTGWSCGPNGERAHRHPVAREFHKERDVVQEERRMRHRLEPIGAMVEHSWPRPTSPTPYRPQRRGPGRAEISQVNATGGRGLPQEVLCAGEHRRGGGRRCEGSRRDADPHEIFWPDPAGRSQEPMTTIEPPQFAEKSVTIP